MSEIVYLICIYPDVRQNMKLKCMIHIMSENLIIQFVFRDLEI